ncbi:MAG: hypothetical protein ABIP95_08690 [Pelobium sp.]
MDKTIITIAAGQKLYVEYACNLALSFLYWNKNTTINFLLITDLPEFIPETIKERIQILSVDSHDIELGFSSKLSLHKFLNTGENLFIDADCLIYGNLLPVFEAFKIQTVSAIGHVVKEGINMAFVDDICKTIKQLEVSYFPVICGSVYYFNTEQKVSLNEFFTFAHKVRVDYESLGLIKLRNKENEEPIIALSMAKFNFMPIIDNGSLKADRMFYDFNVKNILSGATRLYNKALPPIPVYNQLSEARPLIIHYNSRFTEFYEYESDVKRLKMVMLQHYSLSYTNLFVYLMIELPQKIKFKLAYILKENFRPLYRRLFGFRKVEQSKRI